MPFGDVMAHLDPETLSAYVDNRLPPSDAARVEEHLATCSDCKREYRETLGIAELVRELPRYMPRRDIRVDPNVNASAGLLARVIEFSKPLAVAAMVLIVAFAGLRLVDGLINDDADDSDRQMGDMAAPATEVGTERTATTSENVAADEAASDTEVEESQSARPDNRVAEESAAQQTSEADVSSGDAAPAAAEQTGQTAAEPTAPSVPSRAGEDDDTNDIIITGIALAIVVIGILGGGIWLLRSRSTRRAHD